MKNITKKTGYVLTVIVTLVVLTLVFLTLSSFKKPKEITPSEQTTRLLSINPPQNEELKPNLTQKFELIFASIDKTTPINITLTYAPLKDPAKEMVAKISQTTTGNSMAINILEPILPLKTYTLTLTQNNQTLLKQNYISSKIKPTPIFQNDTMLKDFLPYSTQTYSLEYNPSRNIYVAHVKYNPDSSLSLNAQIEAVKADVSRFIQSKEITVDSVKIDYSLK